MALANTSRSYGLVSRTLHWLTAFLIFVAFPLGLVANRTPLADDDAIARVFTLFSLHKTVGIAALAIGLLRIGWSLTQVRPAPLAHRAWEDRLARTTHWTLSVALVVVTLTGWLAHSAAPDLAPIRWPFGQSLRFVVPGRAAAETLGAVHWVFTKVLAVAVLLHIAGALKHTLIDRDGTLARMTSGVAAGTGRRETSLAPPLAAIALWLAALALALALQPGRQADPAVAAAEWPLESAAVTVTDAGGARLATGDVVSVALRLSPDGAGTLDLTLPLDALDGPGIDTVLAAAPFPLLSFAGEVAGTPPDLTAEGTLDLGGAASAATFAVTPDDAGATVAGSAPLPGSPELSVTLRARLSRP